MVSRLVDTSLRHRPVVLLLATLLVALGIHAALVAPLDVFPEFAPPIVEVQSEAPGFGAEDVEALVTTPLEQALAGTPDVAKIRSESSLGLSTVITIFPYGTDPYRARQLVIERVALASEQLPPGVRPRVAPLASVLTTILAVGLRGDGQTSPLVLRDLADWTITPRLLAVPGVANVVVYGGGTRQVQLTTTPERLTAYGATLDDLAAATTAADAPSGSGFLDRRGQRLETWFDGRARSVADLDQAVIPGRGNPPVPLGAVADVGEGAAVPVGTALVDGEPGVLLLVVKQPGVNVVEVTRAVEEALAALARVLPAGVRVDRELFRQATFVEHAIGNLARALVVGGVLVSIVLLVFLGDVRAALASLVAIPLSLLAAVLVLNAFGETLNVMVLGGLAMAVGEVVDDAIIDVENCWRRLQAAPPTARAREVVLRASVEVRSAVVYATFMVALVFLPLFFMGGFEGALFRPLAAAYVLATMASLAVALTVTPVMALLLLPNAAKEHTVPRLVRALRTRYAAALERVLERPGRMRVAAAATVVAGILLAPLLQLEFLPEFHETNLILHMTGAPGVGLDETARVGAAAARALLAVPGVRSVAQFIGRATLAEDHAFGSERGELLVRLTSGNEAAAVTRALATAVQDIAGFTFDVKQYLNERIEETIEGEGAELVVRVRGAELGSIEEGARLLAERIADVPGAVDVHAAGAFAAPGVHVRPRRDDLLRLGVSTAAVGRAIRSVLGGEPVGRLVEGQRQADIVLRVATEVGTDPIRFATLPVPTGGAGTVALGTVADVSLGPLRALIAHEDAVRTVVVRLDARDRSLAAVAADVAEVVRTAPLPHGVYAEVGGEYAAATAARRRLLLLGMVSLLGIFLLLLIDFGSIRLAALTMVNVPLAFVGGLVAVVVGAGGHLSLGAIVGFVTVFGITVRNGIVLIAHFRDVERERGERLDHAGLIVAAVERLAPILMTALVTGIALVPLLLLGGHAGGEIDQPMALVIVGGLVTSTWLNLFIVPSWYARARR
ncbi:MAG TPA: efflux RND transporter permease subunit [Candidatus Eisenbacteria bacterium]|nr:efflux RND transporter permease subunit [Candidatus Eisenbacteria bacterium]